MPPSTQEKFDQIFENLPPVRKKVLELFLAGFSDRKIAHELFISVENPEEDVVENAKKNVATHVFWLCEKFGIEKNNVRRDRLIKLFYRFKRSLLIPPLFDEWTCINSGFYLKPGIEYFERQEYTEATKMFQKAKNADPKDPIAQIWLNNAKAYSHGKPLKIAVVVAYQNDYYRSAADNVLRGVADAQSDFNCKQANDSQPRRLLEVMIVNDRNDTKIAKRVAEILCLDPDILAVIGHHSSEGSQAGLSTYEEGYQREYPLAIISPTSTSSRLKSNILFRNVGSTKIVAETYAKGRI